MKRYNRNFIKNNEICINLVGQLVYKKQFTHKKSPQRWRFLPELYTNSQLIKENDQNLKSIYDI